VLRDQISDVTCALVLNELTREPEFVCQNLIVRSLLPPPIFGVFVSPESNGSGIKVTGS
jgi:hypothetical protein